ncbi:MFS transporter [Alkaliphilus peptidifermentans]|uniref:Major Facilitator Superfamily protein n=1 Tax=Alkaliphilus peptidifermentans DSM 18978 TaxID=1120976 RepID=A0A1G5EJ63_9FIRM|nr:MFS transporter [Alkaliphilus peptidifermentans]SCY27063.1 hypothetical protein SAMN03080606_01178 [Alkaliphilus peptidifermentans DSM 18978]
MKALQRSLLALIISIVLLDLFLQFIDMSVFISLFPADMPHYTLYIWGFPLAFIIGCFIFGYFSYYNINIKWVCIALFMIGICYGVYTVSKSSQTLIYIRLLHGVLLSFVLITSTTIMDTLVKLKEIRKVICQFGVFFTVPAIILTSFSGRLSNLLSTYWSFYTLMFSFIFAATLIILLINYFHFSYKKEQQPSIIQFLYIMKDPGVLYGFLTVTISSFTLGVLNNQLLINNQLRNFPSPMFLLNIFLLSLTIAFITKLSTISDYVGIYKGSLAGLLLIAFALSSFPLVENSTLAFLPIIILGISYGIIIPTTYGGLREINNSFSGIIYGIFYGLNLIGSLTGYFISNTSNNYFLSPLLFTCLLIISCCIPFIRKIHYISSDYFENLY